ncbi:MAG: 3'-5' exonuclease domain-containing protein 2 [Rhodocyclaceae bacterium]|nr:3'-5' exonuclease domain-containing protein 2 [Rhodocyclaceae bacterium]
MSLTLIQPQEGAAAPAALPVYPGIAFAAITLVDSPARAAQALAELMAGDAIGFDTESKPTFVKGEVSSGPHLVQLAAEQKVFLFPINRTLDTDVLKTILEAPQLLKVGFGLGNDRSALKSRLDIELNNVLDLGEVLRGPWHRGTVGAKTAVQHFFGQRFQKSKHVGTSNWASARLTERQQLYAANDAHAALRVYRAWCHAGETVKPL